MSIAYQRLANADRPSMLAFFNSMLRRLGTGQRITTEQLELAGGLLLILLLGTLGSLMPLVP